MDLYALPPEGFTAARDAQARQARKDGDPAGAAALAALRRPSVAARAVNALVRQEPDLLAQLLDLGVELAQAQAAGQGDALRALGEQRRALVEAVADRAAAATGRALGPGARAEVVATLEAALADPPSAQAVRSGRLVRALSFAGFGGVDLAGAVADVPGATEKGAQGKSAAGKDARDKDAKDRGVKGKGAKDKGAETRGAEDKAARAAQAARGRAIAAAERVALAAAGALDDAVRCRAAAAQDQQAAEGQLAGARRAGQEAEAVLVRARDGQAAAQAAERTSARTVAQAGQAVVNAQAAAEQAREALDRLRRA